VWGPRPVYHRTYVVGEPAPVVVNHLPTRKIDRDNSFALGVRAGSLFSGYAHSDQYADFGLGITGRYRPVEFLGLELAVSHHNQNFTPSSERAQWMAQGSAMLFLFPWSHFQPYAIAGLTANHRALEDDIYLDGDIAHVSSEGTLWGPHVGLGVEIGLGKKVALDLEARFAGYVNGQRDDVSLPGSVQTNAGLLFHF
jgi:opacity protein-like surface antigen